MTQMIKLLKIPDLFTMGNLVCGVLAIFAAMEERLEAAAFLILVAMVLDALDGKIAGWLNQQNLLGKQLDSLADLVSFGVAPAAIFHQLGLGLDPALRDTIAVLFVTAGMLRLARYNISNEKGFEGVPITVNGVLCPGLLILGQWYPACQMVWPWLLVLQTFLMVSSLRISRLF